MEGSHERNFDTFDLHFDTEGDIVGDGKYCPLCFEEVDGYDPHDECLEMWMEQQETRRYMKEHNRQRTI